MEWRHPYFSYDVFARIVPGVLTLAAAKMLFGSLLGWWDPLLSVAPPGTSPPGPPGTTPSSGATSWEALAIGAVTLLVAGYGVGLAIEVVLGPMWRFVYRRSIMGAARSKTSWRKLERRVAPSERPPSEIWQRVHQWVVCSGRSGIRDAYPHALRFQAESRALAHSLVPMGLFALAFLVDGKAAVGVSFCIAAITMALLARMREERRWLQILNILDEQCPNDDEELLGLKARLMALSTRQNGPRVCECCGHALGAAVATKAEHDVPSTPATG